MAIFLFQVGNRILQGVESGIFVRGGDLNLENDIRVSPGVTVRWCSAPRVPPLYRHAVVAQILVVIYAAGCLIEPPASTKMSRNLRKRSAKMSFGHPTSRRENCTRRGFN